MYGIGFVSGQGYQSFVSPERQDGPATQPASYSMGTSGKGMMLNTDLHQVPRLRMSGAVTLLSLQPFVVLTNTVSPLRCTVTAPL